MIFRVLDNSLQIALIKAGNKLKSSEVFKSEVRCLKGGDAWIHLDSPGNIGCCKCTACRNFGSIDALFKLL